MKKNCIDWLFDDEEDDDGSIELCGRVLEKYVDIIKSNGFWIVKFDGKQLKNGFNTRDDAKFWIEQIDILAYMNSQEKVS